MMTPKQRAEVVLSELLSSLSWRGDDLEEFIRYAAPHVAGVITDAVIDAYEDAALACLTVAQDDDTHGLSGPSTAWTCIEAVHARAKEATEP